MNFICMFKLALYFNARMSIGNTILPCVTCLWITATLLQKSYVYRPKPHFISIIYIIAEYIGMHDSKNRKYIVGVKNVLACNRMNIGRYNVFALLRFLIHRVHCK